MLRTPRLRRLATVVLVASFVAFFASGAVALFSRHSFALDLVLEVTGGLAILLSGALYPKKSPPAEEHSGPA